MESENFIIGVVVRFGDITICLPSPNRHCHCFQKAREIGITNQSGKADDQGFYLADGTYLNRIQALEHVKKVNQKMRSEPNRYLFSEDLW